MSAWRRLLAVAALLHHHSTALAEPVTEKLFFNDQDSAQSSSRTVQVGQDIVLECEASGRPSPTIYWQHVQLTPVYHTALQRSGVQ